MKNSIRDKINKEEYKEIVITDIVIFLIIFSLTLIYSQTHQEHDSIFDFRMKFPELSVMQVVLNYGNGRFLGNLFGILLIPHPILMSFMKAVIFVLIIDLTTKLFDFRGIYRLYFIVAIGLMTKDFFFQMFYYSSSFFNYIPPLVALLLLLNIINSTEKINVVWVLIVAILAFAGQFFIEHIALINVFIAFCLMVYNYKKNQSRFIYSLIWFVVSGMGLVLMIFYQPLFVDNPLESCHRYADSLSTFVFNMGQMLVAVYLGNVLWGTIVAILYAKYDCLSRQSKDLSKEGACICILIFLSAIGGEGTLLFSPFAIYFLHKRHGVIQKDNLIYIFLYIIIYLSTFLFLFVDFRGESMCLQFSNFCESIFLVLILKEKFKWRFNNGLSSKISR